MHRYTRGEPLTPGPISRDGYRSPARRVGWLTRAFPTCFFHPGIVRIVFEASRLAKRGRYPTAEWAWSAWRVAVLLERIGARIAVDNVSVLERLEGPCVIVGNHMSTLETFVLPGIVAPLRPVTFIVKRSLLHYPLFRHVMRSRNPVAVDRVNPRDDLRAVLQGGAERLAKGISLIVFPQTTRTPRFDPEAFNTIGVKLARKAGVPVVPLALRTDAWGNGKWLKDFGRMRPEHPVHFRFGEPLTVQGSGRETHEAVVRFIQENLADWS
jgi:1-acyl-sn-glycerol-3-phosphate acyltransferase